MTHSNQPAPLPAGTLDRVSSWTAGRTSPLTLGEIATGTLRVDAAILADEALVQISDFLIARGWTVERPSADLRDQRMTPPVSVEPAAPAPPSSPNLLEFIQQLSPRYLPPHHLAPLIRELERSWHEPVSVTACAPPRHGKTETVLAFIVATLTFQPHRTLAYVTYESGIARSKSRKARLLLSIAGVELAPDARRLGEWRTPQGGGLIATGVDGPLTSQGVDIMIVDDPYKNRVDAESATKRQTLTDWWNDAAETRLTPEGSRFILHTRWHTDDLIAHVHGGTGGEKWKHLRLPALDDEGRALWPERWPVEKLQEKRAAVGEYTWASLYQGEPRPRGGSVFSGVHTYDALPNEYEMAIGVDLAYTASTQADWSIAIVLLRSGARYYVKDVRRRQVAAPQFAHELVGMQQQYPSAQLRWYAGGTEKGSGDFLKSQGVNLRVLAPKGDKFVRAQPVAAAWNAGNVLLPARAPWLADFVAVVCGFTGVSDARDDDVDALAAAFDALQGPTPRTREQQERDSAIIAMGPRLSRSVFGASMWPSRVGPGDIGDED